jgi:hypothetical protein
MIDKETQERLEELAQMGGGNNPHLKEEALGIIRKLKGKETNIYRREKLGSLESSFQKIFSNKGCKDYGVDRLRSFIYADLMKYSSWTDEMARKAQGLE